MPYRVVCELVVAKDKAGRNHHCYHGAVIDWLNDEQLETFTRLGLVEEISAAAAQAVATTTKTPPRDADDGELNTDIVAECLSDLARLGVPASAGAPTCRRALRENGIRYANNVIAAAVRARKR